MTTPTQWDWYTQALAGTFGPMRSNRPETGFYRHHTGNAVAIWRDADDSPTIHMLMGTEEITDAVDQERIWIACAKKPVSHEHYVAKTETGEWPALPEVAPTRGPGDNSGDLTTFERMREEILGDAAEAEAFYAKNEIKTKDDADRAMDWGDRLVAAAREANKARLEETRPLREQIDEINARWNEIIDRANRQGLETRDLATVWGEHERDRLRKEAEDRARAAQEAERKRREEEAERRRAEAAKAAADSPDADGVLPEEPDLGFDLPQAGPPLISEPKIMLGTGKHGNRRSVPSSRTPETAAIVDLGQAAAYFADQKHPGLVALVQRLADRAIKARAEIPGIHFSWQDKQDKKGNAA